MECPLRAQRCGGCPLLNTPYKIQLANKQKKIASLFPCAMPILGMKEPFNYRNKVISSFAPGRRGLISGLYAQGSHYVIPVDNCLLDDKRADEIVCVVRGIMNHYHIRAYDEDLQKGVLRHIVVRRARTTGNVLVTVITASQTLPHANDIVSDLLGECPDIVSIVQNINPRRTSAVLGYKEKVLYGSGYIKDVLCGVVFRLSSRSFYQVNSIQTERLYRVAIEMARLTGTEILLDAYCGIGTIGIIAAKHVGCVIGIELNNEALRDAEFNASNNGIKNITFLKGDAGSVMKVMDRKVDVLFLDPPRVGCDEVFLQAVSLLSPQRIVYISCNIDTQVHDIRFLQDNGYILALARGVDMFPHTEHIECVCLLEKGNASH